MAPAQIYCKNLEKGLPLSGFNNLVEYKGKTSSGCFASME